MSDQETRQGTPLDSASRASTLARWLSRVDRWAAWISAGLLFLYVVTGFGMTKPDLVSTMTGGLISWRVAYDMHNVLHIPLIIVFTFHTFTGLRRMLLRRTKRSRLAAGIAIGAGAVILGYMLTLALHQSGL